MQAGYFISGHFCYNNTVSHDLALYMHFPFCRRKCRYCSFVSYHSREADIPLYLDTLKKELAQRISGEHVQTVYFGGGTPSLLSFNQVGEILASIRSVADVNKTAEITFEANPGTIDRRYFASLRKLGINRLSLGVQSLDDAELALLGRIHSAAEAKESFKSARHAGFKNINIDLIYGLPGQTPSGWKNTLEESLEMRPEHFSLYGLSLEDGTPMLHDIEGGQMPGIDSDLSAEEYEIAEDMLSVHGYQHYELSNWAKPGMECHHNLFYWQNLYYIGIGVAAHSYIEGHRMANTSDLDTYLTSFSGNNSFAPVFDEQISPELQLAETIMLGLRLDDGIRIDEINGRLGVDIQSHYVHQLEEMTGYGLLETTGGNIKLTRHGRLLGNEVFWRFLPDCIKEKDKIVTPTNTIEII